MEEHHKYLSYVILTIIWSSVAVLSLVIYILFPNEITYWDKIFDKCTKLNAKYQYIVRMMFIESKVKKLDLEKTTVKLDILFDSDANSVPKSKTSLEIKPKMLCTARLRQGDNHKSVRFLLYRKEALKNITFIVLNHNGDGVIRVPIIEIQDMTEPNIANVAYIGKDISRVSDPTSVQRYGARQREPRAIEQELKTTTSLSALEFIAFFFVAINLMVFFTVYVIPCKEDYFCKDYSNGFSGSVFSGLMASFVAAIVFVIVCTVHRYLIRRSIVKGIKMCSAIRYLFIVFVLSLSATLGLLATIMAANSNRFPKNNEDNDFYHEIYWMFALGIAIAVFFLLWISLIAVIAYLMSFFSEPEESFYPIKSRQSNASVRTGTDSDDDYKKLIESNIKVKSISQYKNSVVSEQVSKRTNESMIPPNKKNKETDGDTGDDYYHQLMSNTAKVKSVSQYPGPVKQNKV